MMKLYDITLPQIANYYLDCRMIRKLFDVFEEGINNKFEIEGDILHAYLATDDLELFYSLRLILEKGLFITEGNKYLYEYELGVDHLASNKNFILSFRDQYMIATMKDVNYTENRDIHIEFNIVIILPEDE